MKTLAFLAVILTALLTASVADAKCGRGKLLGRRGSCGAAVQRTRIVTRVVHRGNAAMSCAPQSMPEAVPAPKKTKK